GIVLGLSGGLDSSVVAALGKNALGKEKVHGMIMPSSSNTKSDYDDAVSLAKNLGISYEAKPIEGIIDSFRKTVLFNEKMSYANIKPRIRMALLYGYANSKNYLVAGTGNRSEIMIGYFTKFGDGGADIFPIGSLYKTQVFELAKYLGIPEPIINKKPSAGLWENQTDEDEIGITYHNLDLILAGIELGLSDKEIYCATGIDDSAIEMVVKRIRNSAHKRIAPKPPKINSFDFGDFPPNQEAD
ncbi:MAG: NAD+ synthase, partial [Candidatus Woesearchaeota archaeon]|nr:NAD+ synthase [Candidatus Woesearchaeota archaeon]